MQIKSFKTYLEYKIKIVESYEMPDSDDGWPYERERDNAPGYDNIPNIGLDGRVCLSIHALKRTGNRNIGIDYVLTTLKEAVQQYKTRIKNIPINNGFIIINTPGDIAVAKIGDIDHPVYQIRTVHQNLHKKSDQPAFNIKGAMNKIPSTKKDPAYSVKIDNNYYSFKWTDLEDLTPQCKRKSIKATLLQKQALEKFNHESTDYSHDLVYKADLLKPIYVVSDAAGKYHLLTGEYIILRKLGYKPVSNKFDPLNSKVKINIIVVPFRLIGPYDMSHKQPRRLPENTFKQYLDQLADKLSKPKMIVEYPVKSNQIQGSNMHKDNNNIAALLLDERIKNAERVDMDAIQEKSILDTFDVNELFETFPDSKEIVEFLSTLETTQGIVGHNYIYVSITTLPISKRITINHFTTPRKLVKIVDNQYYFDINDVIKGFPLVERTGGDMFRKSFLLNSIKDCNDLILLIKLRYSDWNINPTTFNESVIENKLILKIGDLAEKYKCSLMMVEMALKQGIREELKNIKDFKAAKLAALKNINKKLDYYKKTTT